MRNGSTNSIADWHRHCQLTQQAPFHLFLLQVFASSGWDHAIRFKNLYMKRFFGIVYCSLSFSDRIPEYPARSSLHEDVQSCWKVQETYTYTFKMQHSIMSNFLSCQSCEALFVTKVLRSHLLYSLTIHNQTKLCASGLPCTVTLLEEWQTGGNRFLDTLFEPVEVSVWHSEVKHTSKCDKALSPECCFCCLGMKWFSKAVFCSWIFMLSVTIRYTGLKTMWHSGSTCIFITFILLNYQYDVTFSKFE